MFSIAGPKIVPLIRFEDQRGWFLELFSQEQNKFVQDNLSFSRRGVIRGMHFQRSPGQAKLLTVLQGEVLDVFVDLRKSSPTFLKWESVALDCEKQLYLPVGFAHGFCVVSETALVHYKVSSLYNPEEEKAFRYDDPTIGIKWPITDPILSERDRNAPYFSQELICT